MAILVKPVPVVRRVCVIYDYLICPTEASLQTAIAQINRQGLTLVSVTQDVSDIYRVFFCRLAHVNAVQRRSRLQPKWKHTAISDRPYSLEEMAEGHVIHEAVLEDRCGLADIYVSRLATWVSQNRAMFANVETTGCFGKIDDDYVYITNKAFQSFCESHQYDSRDVLRVLSSAGCIRTRIGTFHGGHYKTTRICREPASCVWLIKDSFELGGKLEDP